MSILKIAFTGVFDIENYGDQLFPLIFRREMQRRELSVEVYLFSVTSGTALLGGEEHIYAISELEQLHKDINFDAIIVGGGEVIHFYAYEHLTRKSVYEKYCIFDLWMIPSLISNKYNIKLLWNVPGVPYDFEGVYRELARSLIAPVDYLTVRNKSSVESIKRVSNAEISVYPDTGFLVKELFEENLLRDRRKTLLGNISEYIIFHASKLMPESDYEEVALCIAELKKQGYEVVFLPTAYTNGDAEFLSRFNEYCGNQYTLLKNKLSVMDMISILSGCKLYIGFSFHGAITAFSYGKRVIAYDYAENRKTVDLFDLICRSNCYTRTGKDLRIKIKDGAWKLENTKIHDQLSEKVKKHFDNIVEILLSEKDEIKNYDLFNWEKITLMLSDQILELKNQVYKNQKDDEKMAYIENLEKNVQEQSTYIRALEKDKIEQQTYIENLTQNVERQQAYIKALEKDKKYQYDYICSLEKKVQYMEPCEQKYQKSISVIEKQKQLIDRQQKKLLEQAQMIEKVQKSFVGKILLKK